MWQDLVRVSLIGTDKASPSIETMEALQKWGIQSDELSELVLEGAGVLSFLKKGALPLKSFENQDLSNSENEILETVNAQSALHLKEILRGGYSAAFPEYLYYLEARNKILPPEYLPEIFHIYRGDSVLIPVIAQRMGKRGEWLAEINDNWNYFNNKNVLYNVHYTSLTPQETIAKGRELVDLFKAYSFIWSDEKKLNAEIQYFAYHADIKMIDNIESLFENSVSYQWSNKYSEIMSVMRFRRKMIENI